MRHFVIVGAGGLAGEVAALLLDEGYTVFGLLGLPDEMNEIRYGYPVIGTDEDMPFLAYENKDFAMGIGFPQIKRAALQHNIPACSWPIVVSKHAVLMRRSTINLGAGVLIQPGCSLTTHIAIGDWTFVNLNVTIGHDTRIGKLCQVNPGANISGAVTIGDGVLIGTGAAIKEGVTIGGGATVGAGAVVVKDVEPGVTVVGVPAKPLMKRDPGLE